MLRQASALAAHPDEFAPKVIPLDFSRDSLYAFAPETPATPWPRVATAVPSSAGPQIIRLRLPKWIDHAGMAIVAVALSGMVIVVSARPHDPAAPMPGTLVVTSDPAGAPVSLDGATRGATPYTAGLAAGSYRVTVGTGAGMREQVLRVTSGGQALLHVALPAAHAIATSPLDAAHAAAPAAAPSPAPVTVPAPKTVVARAVPSRAVPASAPASPRVSAEATFRAVPSGWLAVTSAFPVQVVADGHEIGTSAARLSMPAGAHTVTLVNEALEFREVHEVTVGASRTATLVVEPPSGTLHVNAQPWATVYVDGRRIGDTPIGNLSLPIGPHEVTLRHPDRGEQHRTVLVGARTPARIGVEFTP